MPAVVKLGKDSEQHWDEAKAKVRQQYPDIPEKSDRFYALVMAIWKKMTGYKPKTMAKAESLDQRRERLRNAFNAQYGMAEAQAAVPRSTPWIVEVFDDHVIVGGMADGNNYSVPYRFAEDGTIIFDWEQRRRVQQEWLAKAPNVFLVAGLNAVLTVDEHGTIALTRPRHALLKAVKEPCAAHISTWNPRAVEP